MPDAKNTFSNSGFLFDLSSVTGTKYSDAITFRTEQIGCTVETVCTVAGSLQVQHYNNSSQSGESLLGTNFVSFVASRPTLANTPDRFEVSGHNEPIRLVFTPTDGAATYDLKVKVSGFGG